MRRALLIIGLFLSLSGLASAQTVDEIIGRYLKSIGGVDKIHAVKTLRRNWKFIGGGGFEAVVARGFDDFQQHRNAARLIDRAENGDELLALGRVGFVVDDGFQGFGDGCGLALAKADRGRGGAGFGHGGGQLDGQVGDRAAFVGGFEAGHQPGGVLFRRRELQQLRGGEQVFALAGGGVAAHEALGEMLADDGLIPKSFIAEQCQDRVTILIRFGLNGPPEEERNVDVINVFAALSELFDDR